MISKAKRSDLEQILKIHKSALPNDFLTNLSDIYLVNHFYPLFLDRAFFLIENENSKVLGFIIITPKTDEINQTIFYNINTFKEIMKMAFKKPWFILKNIYGILFSKKYIETSFLGSPEIYLIALETGSQRKGIGSSLLRAGLEDLIRLGYNQCIVKTLSKNATNFYQKNGFNIIGKEIRNEKTLTVLGKVLQ